MAIDFAAFEADLGGPDADDGMQSEIKPTPLVDVMLVLLIIFLITIPVVNAAVAVNLPREINQLRQALPQTVIVSVDAVGSTYWFDAKLGSSEILQQRLTRIAAQKPQPEVHIWADAHSDFEAVAQVVYACQVAAFHVSGF